MNLLKNPKFLVLAFIVVLIGVAVAFSLNSKKETKDSVLAEQMCIIDAKASFMLAFRALCVDVAKTQADKDLCADANFDRAKAFSEYTSAVYPNDSFTKLWDSYERNVNSCNK